MKRRTFLQATSALSAGAVLVGCGSDDDSIDWTPIEPGLPIEPDPDETAPYGYSACLVNCGSNCPVKVFTNEDGSIANIETDHNIEDEAGKLHQVRACARGRSLKQRTYAPDRLKQPMKRFGMVGKPAYSAIVLNAH